MQETALRHVHEQLGARMVPFAGWTMPVQYSGLLEEAKHVRARAGAFDLGHMGRLRVEGRDAEALLQQVQTNDAARIPIGAIRYSLLLDERGLTQDDVLVYRNPENDGFFVVVNASNTARDLEILRRAARGFGEVRIHDDTQALGMFAIQGPRSQQITQPLVELDLAGLKYYGWARTRMRGVPIAISRTGYTGEDGFEFYVPQSSTVALWQALLLAGRDEGLIPCGLGARDTLRHEAGMPLYGHEIDETTNPLEAGLGWAVKFTHPFTGRQALEKVLAAGGTGRVLVGMRTDSRRCPRQGYPVHAPGDPNLAGKVCSGSVSPTLHCNIATAYVPVALSAPGTAVEFAIKDKREPAVVCPLPFYKRAR
jgi:aminomethyltransferase